MINKKRKEIEKVLRELANYDGEKVLLDNILSYVNEVQHCLNEFIRAKKTYIEQSRAEEKHKMAAAHAEIVKQCWINHNHLFDRGRQRFEPILKGRKEEGYLIMKKWDHFYRESRLRIAAVIGNTDSVADTEQAAFDLPTQ